MGDTASGQAYLDCIRRRREEILARVDAALARSGRAVDAARVMAVSKTVGVDEVAAAIEVGYRFFGSASWRGSRRVRTWRRFASI